MKIRQSNFELLRIICAISVLVYHFFNTSVNLVLFSESQRLFSYAFFYSGGRIAVNIFVMISSYFLIESSFNIKRIVNTWMTILFYTVGISFLLLIIGEWYGGSFGLVRAFMPFSGGILWYYQPYIVLLFIFPLLNIIIKKITQKQLKHLILLLLFMYVVLGTIPKLNVFYNNLGWFMVIYLIIGYIRVYNVNFNYLFLIFIFISNYFLLVISHYDFNYYLKALPGLSTLLSYLGYYDSMFDNVLSSAPSFLASLSLFLIFKNLHIRNLYINKIASMMGDIYIIYAISYTNYDGTWWTYAFKIKDKFYNCSNIITIYLFIVGIFILGIVIGYIKTFLFRKYLINSNFYNSVCNKLTQFLK